MRNLSLVRREWPTRIALIFQALTMGAIITVILTMLFL